MELVGTVRAQALTDTYSTFANTIDKGSLRLEVDQ